MEELQRKIRLVAPYAGKHHRSGWPVATSALEALHTPNGVYVDDFIERSFLWHSRWWLNWMPNPLFRTTAKLFGIHTAPFRPPYRAPWIGFLHDPPHIPKEACPFRRGFDVLSADKRWQASMQSCKGLFTLSQYLRDAVQPHVPVPVENLLHPTEEPPLFFDLDQYLDSDPKQVVQVGWWLRKLGSIYALNAPDHQQVHLIVNRPCVYTQLSQDLQRRKLSTDNVLQMQQVSDDEYDTLLSRSIVFLDMYDSSANNAITECIARATPVLLNRLPAAEEYLGSDYPLFFEDLSQASKLLRDTGAITAAHEHLRDSTIRPKLTKDYFLQSFAASNIYQSLPVVQ